MRLQFYFSNIACLLNIDLRFGARLPLLKIPMLYVFKAVCATIKKGRLGATYIFGTFMEI
jgi:hypothetical protein